MGKSDLFAPGKRSGRLKFAGRLYYSPGTWLQDMKREEGRLKAERQRLDSEQQRLEAEKAKLTTARAVLQNQLDEAQVKATEADETRLAADEKRLTADRKKFDADLAKNEDAGSYVNFFAEAFFDTDRGRGSDDIQIDYGVTFDIDRVLRKLGGP